MSPNNELNVSFFIDHMESSGRRCRVLLDAVPEHADSLNVVGTVTEEWSGESPSIVDVKRSPKTTGYVD